MVSQHALREDAAAESLHGAAVARRILTARRRRERTLGDVTFGEPSWDILLELYVAAASDRRVCVSDLTLGATVPPTTALRWITAMTDRGQIIRRRDPRDGRRTYLSLSPEVADRLGRLLGDWDGPSSRGIGDAGPGVVDQFPS